MPPFEDEDKEHSGGESEDELEKSEHEDDNENETAYLDREVELSADEKKIPSLPEEVKEDVTFASLGLVESLVEACTALGWKKPSDIQRESLPWALQGTCEKHGSRAASLHDTCLDIGCFRSRFDRSCGNWFR